MYTISKFNIYFLIFIYPLLPIIKEHSLTLGNIIEGGILLVLFLNLIICNSASGWKISIHKKVFFITLLLIIETIFYLSDFFDTEVYDVFSASRVFLFYIFLIGNLEKLIREDNIECDIIAKALAMVSMLFAIGAIFQFVIPDVFLSVHAPNITVDLRSKSDFIAFSIFNRVFSFLNDPNIFGVFSAFCFFICFKQYRENNKNLIFLVAIVGNILGIILSQSRTAIILIGIFFILQFLLSLFAKKKIKPLQLFLILLVLCGFAYLILINVESVFEFLRVDTILTGNGRVTNNVDKVNYLIDQGLFGLLLGNGMGIERDIIFENSYLLLIYQTGILGFLLFIMASIFLLGKNLNTIKTLPIVLCYLSAAYVGDYILIPQITYLVIIAVFIVRYPKDRSVVKK